MATKHIEYNVDDSIFEGYFAYDDNVKEKRPLILIAHAWAGRDDFACNKAKKMVELGYTAFAMDVYGKGKIGTSNEENSALMNPLVENRALLRKRLLAAYHAATKLDLVDQDRVVVIGYCFGGLCALDLMRTGVNLKGVVTFHGFLAAPSDDPKAPVKAKVLALHGHQDPMVGDDQLKSFAREMDEKNVDWQLHIFGKAQHAFTNPNANDTQLGLIYNRDAERRSWQMYVDFCREVFS